MYMYSIILQWPSGQPHTNSVSYGPSGPWETHPVPTGTVHPVCPGPSCLCLFSEHNIFMLENVPFWMKKLCDHATYFQTSGSGEYPTQPPFLPSVVLCHLASLLDFPDRSQTSVHSAPELQESPWRPVSRLERRGRCPPHFPAGGRFSLNILSSTVPIPVMWAQ